MKILIEKLQSKDSNKDYRLKMAIFSCQSDWFKKRLTDFKLLTRNFQIIHHGS